MSDDVFTQGYQGWEKRFQMGHRGEDVMQRAIEQEVMIAADAYQMRYGGGVARAVDIGAGDGRHTIYLASRGFDVLAVDAAPTGIERIREKLERESLSAQLTVADLRTYQLPDQIDLLLASYIVHLLPNPYDQIKTWQKKVRPGGMCVVATRTRFSHDPAEYWFPEDFELQRLFEEAGWFVLHAREEVNWEPKMERHFRRRAVVAVKPPNN